MITFSFEGTSHGEGYHGKICGLPKGFAFSARYVEKQLAMRKKGVGRSDRQQFDDKVIFKNAVGDEVKGESVEFFLPNARVETRGEITAVRSGHSDVTGRARFPHMSVRQIAEIASARNSVCYVVLGAICKQLLEKQGIFTFHYTQRIGGVSSKNKYVFGKSEQQPHFEQLHCPCRYATSLMLEKIKKAKAEGNSLGGIAVAGAVGVPMGVGEILPYASRLDAQIAANLVGIPSVKGIVFGSGEKLADMDGVSAHDRLTVQDGEIVYAENKCGGIVGGVSNGRDILCRLFVKPVPTVKGVETVDCVTLQSVVQHTERADVCVVPNVGVIAENILAYVIANQMLRQKLL